MGVKGLNSLVSKSNILKESYFSKSHIVIDGPNLYYYLYCNCKPDLDFSHGGDYSGFKDKVCEFFDTLTRCNITPLVILDGRSAPEKDETILSRQQKKLEQAKSISESRPDRSTSIIPPLVKDVFIQTLKDRQVELEQCFGEADQTTALRANEKKCPVLSMDSDFFIFNLEEGFFPLRDFKWGNVTENQTIPAKLYTVSEFQKHFKLSINLMPVFAALSGNDYSGLKDKGKFVNKYFKGKTPTMIEHLQAIIWFLRTLNNVTIEEAMREALSFAGEPPENRQVFLDSVQSYNTNINTLFDPYDLPPWIKTAVLRGELTSFVTMVCTKKMILTPLVEDFSQPSSYGAALRIRQFFYGLLLGDETCTEYDREGEKAGRPKEVPPILPRVSSDDLQLERLNVAPERLRKDILFEALNVSISFDETSQECLKLPLCVTQFWYKYRHDSHPGPVNQFCLQALLLGFVYGEDETRGEFKERMNALKVEQVTLDIDVTHAFSQWQCCMRQSLHLNQLLSFPLKEPHCSRLYCGPLLHVLVDHLKKNRTYFTDLQELLDERWKDFLQTSLISCRAGLSDDDKEGLTAQKSEKKKKRRGENSGSVVFQKKPMRK